jgi:transmembrane sensor
MHKERLWHLVSKKLAQEATAEELAELEELLRQHPEIHYAIQHIQDLWKLQPLQSPETEEAFQKHLSRMQDKGIDTSPWMPGHPQEFQEPARPSRLRRYLLAGLSIAAITTVGILLLNREPKAQSTSLASINEISTRNGSRTRISLPDGSTVWLNAGSKLVYDKNFDSKLREVTLAGEAYFDVARNPEKPFIIHTGKVDIKVLGTLFNVKSYPGEKVTEASLIRGSIEVMIRDRPQEKIILKPNEKIVVSNETEQETSAQSKPVANNAPIVAISHLSYEPKDSTIIETSWVENKLILQDESLEETAVRLERWYGVLIRFENNEVKKLRFTGPLPSQSIQKTLEALKITGGFNFTINENNVLIY